jgi:hypothetical protein
VNLKVPCVISTACSLHIEAFITNNFDGVFIAFCIEFPPSEALLTSVYLQLVTQSMLKLSQESHSLVPPVGFLPIQVAGNYYLFVAKFQSSSCLESCIPNPKDIFSTYTISTLHLILRQ